MIRNPIGIFYEYYNRNRIDSKSTNIHGKMFFIIKKMIKKAPWYVVPRYWINSISK